MEWNSKDDLKKGDNSSGKQKDKVRSNSWTLSFAITPCLKLLFEMLFSEKIV